MNKHREEGISLSSAGVRCVWMRDNIESADKRLRALEEKVAKEGIVLTKEKLGGFKQT